MLYDIQNDIQSKPMSGGALIWITGLAGAGKSTIARALADSLRKGRANVVLVDGDEFRELVGDSLGHEPHERLENAWRIARFCRFLASQGQITVCSTVSMYRDVRRWLRESVPDTTIVYLKVSEQTLRARDKKGLYSGAARGEVANVAGVNLPIELPEAPDLLLENDLPCGDFSPFVDAILQAAKLRRP